MSGKQRRDDDQVYERFPNTGGREDRQAEENHQETEKGEREKESWPPSESDSE